MKKTFLVILLFISFVSFSQLEKTNIKQSNPNPKNELSKYLKKNVPKKLLKKVRYPNSLNLILMSFYINKENKPSNINLNSFGNFELQTAIEKAFKNYPLEKLNLGNFDKSKEYYLQLIRKSGYKSIFSCSTKILTKTLPVCDECNDLEYYKDIETCIQLKIKKHFYNSLDFSLLDNLEDNSIAINITLGVNKEGELYFKKGKSPEVLKENILKVINEFPKFREPATVNNQISVYSYSFSTSFKKGETPKYIEPYLIHDSIFNPNTTNSFAKYLSQNINTETLDKNNLNRIHDRITLSFELDKKNKPFNIKTNARSSDLKDVIISLFKNYDIDKLNIPNISPFNSYFTQILSFEDNQVLIKTNEMIGYQKVPVFPGCENSKSLIEAKKCFSKGVQEHFSRTFDADLPNELGLFPGRKRVFIGFEIDTEGNITNIKAKAPHPRIKQEVIKVMQTMPRVIPGMQYDKNVNIKYSIPFTLVVQ
jgi:hypothetical protein